MNSRDSIQNELKDLSAELPLLQHSPFAVPAGYFDGLAASVLARIKVGEDEGASPLLASIPKGMPYAVPSGYFAGNLAQLSVDDVSSELLTGISKRLPYQVPADYFDTLPTIILTKVTKPQARVIPLFARPWMRVAAAAVVVAALVTGGIQIFNGSKSQTVAVQSNVPANKEVAITKPVLQQEIKAVSTRELEQFIENVPVAGTVAEPAQTQPMKAETEALLKDVSVNEMESFLAVLPTGDDELGATN